MADNLLNIGEGRLKKRIKGRVKSLVDPVAKFADQFFEDLNKPLPKVDLPAERVPGKITPSIYQDTPGIMQSMFEKGSIPGGDLSGGMKKVFQAEQIAERLMRLRKTNTLPEETIQRIADREGDRLSNVPNSPPVGNNESFLDRVGGEKEIDDFVEFSNMLSDPRNTPDQLKSRQPKKPDNLLEIVGLDTQLGPSSKKPVEDKLQADILDIGEPAPLAKGESFKTREIEKASFEDKDALLGLGLDDIYKEAFRLSGSIGRAKDSGSDMGKMREYLMDAQEALFHKAKKSSDNEIKAHLKFLKHDRLPTIDQREISIKNALVDILETELSGRK